MLEYVLFFIVYFFSNIIQVFTGFGGTMLAMPFSILLLGVNTARAVLNASGIITCAVVALLNRKHIRCKEFLKISLIMLAGVIFGLWLFEQARLALLLKIYAGVIIAVALFNIFSRIKIRLPLPVQIIVLFCAGVIHGMFISGGSLLVVYSSLVLTDKKEFRATLSLVWVFLNALLAGYHFYLGYFTPAAWLLILISVPIFAATLFIGNLVHKKINQKAFYYLVNALLIVSGIVLLVT